MPPRPLSASFRAPVAALLAAVLTLAACGSSEPILPGDRFPVRPQVAPLSATDAAAAAPVALPAPVANADWSHRTGTAGGRLAHPALSPQPQLRWSADIGAGETRRSRLLASPIAAGGLIFALDAEGLLSAVTGQGGGAWSRTLVPEGQLADAGPGGGLAQQGGVLYATTGFGEVFALNPASGAVIWRRTLEGPIGAAPSVADGRVVVVVRNDTAYALDAASGATLWRAQGVGGTGVLGGATAALGGQLAVVPFASGEVLGLLARNGLQIWGTAVTGGRRELVRNRISDITGDPVIDGGVVYASNQGGRTIKLDLRSGERLWTMAEGAYGPAWPVGGAVFLLSDLGALVRADAGTGAVVWSVQLPEYYDTRRRIAAIPHYGPVLAGGRLWVASGDGLLRAFSPTSGAALGEIALPGGAASSPVVAGGVMYVVSRDGRLHAFQ